MPIVDELLDELVGAAWFTQLDFKWLSSTMIIKYPLGSL